MASASSSLNLFLSVVEPSGARASVDLSVFGSTGSGGFKGADLYLSGGNIGTGQMPLFLSVSTTGEGSGALPLSIGGAASAGEGTTTLFLQNNGVASGITLYIRGAGTTAGATPASGLMNLFIRRAPSEAITLYIGSADAGPSGVTPLFIHGAQGVASGMTLAMPDVVGVGSGSVKLFISGF